MIQKWLQEKGLENNRAPEKIEAYSDLLIKEKKIRNIVGVRDRDSLVEKHIIPSMELAMIIKEKRGVDIGSGNGLPGIVIALMKPDISMILIEPKISRVNFLNMVVRKLCPGRVDIICMRSEDAGKCPEYREKYDFATCRAVADLIISAELVLPLLTVGGCYYAQVGSSVREKTQKAASHINILGGVTADQILPDIALIQKKYPTPADFPRSWKRISAKNS